MSKQIDKAELARIGERLYGHRTRWQSRMAGELGVSRATVAAWAAGDRSVPPAAVVALRLLVEKRAADIFA